MINDVRMGSKYRASQPRWMVAEGKVNELSDNHKVHQEAGGLAHQVPETSEKSQSQGLAKCPGHLTETGSL